jgi:DNA repair exonuclease SbcCD nuclease subunit
MDCRTLWVGDPHVKPDNIGEWTRLIDFILEKALEHKTQRIVFSGDMFHTHMVIRMDVQNFWMNALKKLTTNLPLCGQIILLKGNHDIAGDREREESMSALDIFEGYPKVTVVKDWHADQDFGYIGYVSGEDKFLEYCQKIKEQNPKVDTVFCHQTFDGSTYDNGFYAPDGFDPAKVPFDQVISGHIHTQQTLGKVFYGGTPRWDTASDANQQKGIWIFQTGEEPLFLSTEAICTPIYRYTIKEGDEIPEAKDGQVVYLDLEGSSDWIVKTSKKLKGKCRVTPKPTDSILKKEKKETVTDISKFLSTQGLDEDTSKKVLEYIRAL